MAEAKKKPVKTTTKKTTTTKAKKAPAKKTKQLTMKELLFVKELANGKTQAEAYALVYDTKGNPATIKPEANRTANKPHIREALEMALLKHGITVEAVVAPIAAGLSAVREIPTDAGVLTSVDHTTRLKAASMAGKWLGLDESVKESTGKGDTFNFNFGANSNARKYVDHED